ncbi:hypothetical protein Tco_0855996 [Tanacetum coccineum]
MSRDVITVGSTMRIPATDGSPILDAEEKKNRKIDRLARSLLIQGLPNDIYSYIDSNDTAEDLWDALERQMRGSEYIVKLNYKFLTICNQNGNNMYTDEAEPKNLMDINIDALDNILKQNKGDVNDSNGH